MNAPRGPGRNPIVYTDDGRLRSGWRILLFVALFVLYTLAGGLLAALAGVPPGAGGLFVQGIVTLAAALGAGWTLLARVDGRSLGALGFAWTRASPREIGGGLAIGGGALGAVVGALALLGMVGYAPEPGTAVGYATTLLEDFVGLALPAAAEEALFRGYAFQVLVQGIGAAGATVLSSIAFAAVHLGNPNVGAFALTNIFLAGVLLSVAYLRTRSLWFASAVHLGWNWAMASLFDLPVSGLRFLDTPFYEPVLSGIEWVTGGVFGPEGGIAGTIGFLLAFALVWKLPGLDEADEVRERRPLVDERLRGNGIDDAP